MGDTLPDDWTYEDQRRALDRLSDEVGEWQGIPVPVEGRDLRLCKGHPLAEFYKPAPEVRVVVGGPSDPDDEDRPLEERVLRCFVDDTERVVNQWYDGKRNRDVLIVQRGEEGRAFAVTVPRAPDRSMERLTLAVSTIGASDAWDLAAEHKARAKLYGMLSERQWRHYDLTGTFLETSPRSGLTYIFRRLRPTVAMTPRWPWYRPRSENMRCLAVLCLHPIGFYDRTWAGCMVPTDDVIAHLLMVRGDEAGFWRHANQHDPASPEAGL